MPHDAPDKGVALARERQRLGCSTAIYVGDDETDERAFSPTGASRMLGIRVEPAEHSHATHFIPDQSAINDLLRVLLALRNHDDPGRQRWFPPPPRS